MDVKRKTLFRSASLQIGSVEARPSSDACSEAERQVANAMVLPLWGVFSRHDAPGRQVIGTPGSAVFFAADTPYRVGFPGAIGDRGLVLRFDQALAADQLGGRGASETFTTHGLLAADAMVLRNLLWLRLKSGEADQFGSEALGLDLLSLSLASMHAGGVPQRSSTRLRWTRALARVKEAVAVAPAARWSVARLASIAHLSPFHLCHVFRQMAGISIYDYVLRERLAASLEAIVQDGSDLTAIALEAGFASHSHFTARFRGFFGCTPAEMRRCASRGRVAELRKIMTAARKQLV
jgi:AraC family transcriptional regulator